MVASVTQSLKQGARSVSLNDEYGVMVLDQASHPLDNLEFVPLGVNFDEAHAMVEVQCVNAEGEDAPTILCAPVG